MHRPAFTIIRRIAGATTVAASFNPVFAFPGSPDTQVGRGSTASGACPSNNLHNPSPVILENRPTHLHTAASSGDLQSCLKILRSGCIPVNSVDSDGSTPVICAARSGNAKVIEVLIGAGANLEISDVEGWSPLHWAAETGQLHVIGVLLDRCPVLINHRDKRGLTALHVAAWRGNAKMVHRLILEGADVKEVTHWGETALHHAAYFGHREVCVALLKAGADQRVLDKMNRSPATLGRERMEISDLFSNGDVEEPKTRVKKRKESESRVEMTDVPLVHAL